MNLMNLESHVVDIDGRVHAVHTRFTCKRSCPEAADARCCDDYAEHVR